MRTIYVFDKNSKLHRVTVTPTRITLKIVLGTPEELRTRIIKFAEQIEEATRGITKSLHATIEFSDNYYTSSLGTKKLSAVLQTDSRDTSINIIES